MKEILITKFKLHSIENISFISYLCELGYRKTGNKFRVSFNGSKGYLDNFEISCEGYQNAYNRISFDIARNDNGTLKKRIVNVFYSDQNGIRLSIGADKPQIITKTSKMTCDQASNDLPF